MCSLRLFDYSPQLLDFGQETTNIVPNAYKIQSVPSTNALSLPFYLVWIHQTFLLDLATPDRFLYVPSPVPNSARLRTFASHVNTVLDAHYGESFEKMS